MNNRPAVPQPLRIAAVLLILVIFAGTAGYVVLEGWSGFRRVLHDGHDDTTGRRRRAGAARSRRQVWTIGGRPVGFAA